MTECIKTAEEMRKTSILRGGIAFVGDCADYPLYFETDGDKKMSSDEGFFDGFDITKENPAALMSGTTKYFGNWWE